MSGNVSTTWVVGVLLAAGDPCCNSAPNRPEHCDETNTPELDPNSRASGHHHPESCWISKAPTLDGGGEETALDEGSVDMMLFVVGLNHRMGVNENVPVGLDGVQRLADAIVAAWPYGGENVVVVSSAFSRECAPSSGACLKTELEKRYGIQFYFHEVDDSVATPTKYGSKGILSGRRWYPEDAERMYPGTDPELGVARVFLRDAFTGVGVDVYAMHTDANEASIAEIGPIAQMAASRFVPGSLTPLIAGDFNFHLEDPQPAGAGAAIAAQFIRDNFTWINEDVGCTGVFGLPDGLFRIQNGNVMHAFTGRYSASIASYPCAVGELERVRLSYSVDQLGRLAIRGGDSRSAIREGIILDDIAHNVLAFGLRIKARTDPLPDSCKSVKQDCVRTTGPYTWSCEGKLDESQYDCVAIDEPADPHFKDNFLCLRKGGPSGAAVKWSYAGPIDGMRCAQVYEGAEPAEHAWGDNFICVRRSSTGLSPASHFTWSEAGPIPGRECLQWFEPEDPHAWNDNYLCW